MSQAPTAKPILAFGVSNFRSFGRNGFVLSGLKKVNVLIGKNNAGKSNVLHAIERFLSPGSRRGHSEADLHVVNGITDKTAPVHRVFLSCDYLALKPKANHHPATIRQVGQNLPEGLEIAFDTNRAAVVTDPSNIPLFKRNPEQHVVRSFFEAVTGRSFSSWPAPATVVSEMYTALSPHANEWFREQFPNPLKIPVFRRFEYQELPLDQKESQEKSGVKYFDGKGLIRELRRRQSPRAERGHEREPFDRLQGFVRKLLGDDLLKIEIPPEEAGTPDEIVITTGGVRKNLERFGTGLHHLILICAALAMHEGTVLLEEPEIHMHPDLQRHLLKFMLDNTQNTYFITSHSNVFLDYFSHDQIAIFHVQHDGTQSTVGRVDAPDAARGILRDLGYKASDLLQSNGVIWVEGPSDRIFLIAWLQRLAPDLVEGIDFQVVFYAGSLLTHYGFNDDPTQLIQALRINPNVFVLMDRDADEGQPPSKLAVNRVIGELGTERCWVTRGREIENYVRQDRVREVVGAKYSEVGEVTFGTSVNIADVLIAVPGFPQSYEKVRWATEFVKTLGEEDLAHLDLRSDVDRLVAMIRQWNKGQRLGAANPVG